MEREWRQQFFMTSKQIFKRARLNRDFRLSNGFQRKIARVLRPLKNAINVVNCNMSNPAQKTDPQEAREGELPVHVPVWVQCDGYRCKAFKNRKGEWLSYPSKRPLYDVVRVLGDLEGG